MDLRLPTTLPPLQVDQDKEGKDSDHNVVVFAPNSNTEYKQSRKKKTILTRPLPDSNILKFEKELSRQAWDEMFMNKSADDQVNIFHGFLRSQLDRFFPQKSVKLSSLDKKWMHPSLKQLNRQLKR